MFVRREELLLHPCINKHVYLRALFFFSDKKGESRVNHIIEKMGGNWSFALSFPPVPIVPLIPLQDTLLLL